jgi:hypothetical protein
VGYTPNHYEESRTGRWSTIALIIGIVVVVIFININVAIVTVIIIAMVINIIGIIYAIKYQSLSKAGRWQGWQSVC